MRFADNNTNADRDVWNAEAKIVTPVVPDVLLDEKSILLVATNLALVDAARHIDHRWGDTHDYCSVASCHALLT